MSEDARAGRYSEARLNDRQVTELIGLARGLIADGRLNDPEIQFLHKWLVASGGVSQNPLVAKILSRIEEILEDGIVDDDERGDLFETLQAFAGNDFEVGEILKSTTLPLCDPAPELFFEGARFTFTGTFVFGKRRDCEATAVEGGAVAGSLTQKTTFLVIGEYATDSWAQSSFGRKIEKAAGWRDAGIPISIISEAHWRKAID